MLYIYKYIFLAKQYFQQKIEFVLVINGVSLHHAMTGEACRVFTELVLNCKSVVCCRMTPMQKAEVVEIIRKTTNEVVVAVGDGANDVAMIQVFI